MFCMTTVRLDIAHAVSGLAMHMAQPRAGDWKRAMRVVRYLAGTITMGILFPYSATDVSLVCYVDPDWAGDLDTRKSRTGFVVTLVGAPISWYSGLQSIVAVSSTEAEYLALATAGVEVVYLRQLLEFLHHPQEGPSIVREDNTGAINWANDPVNHTRSKHVDIRYHKIRERVEHKVLKLHKIDTANDLSDPFTRALTRDTFQRLIGSLMRSAASFREV
mmetsp:Transcript_5076/g.15008  ORF Transcript_5076/g.15008 Transcript_5076/m.15008 type:complete len:219 (-) Transcript_5076:79-735(-)